MLLISCLSLLLGFSALLLLPFLSRLLLLEKFDYFTKFPFAAAYTVRDEEFNEDHDQDQKEKIRIRIET